MSIVKYVIVGISFAAMFGVIAVLAFRPAFIAVRDWFRKRKQLAKPIGPGIDDGIVIDHSGNGNHGIIYGSTPIVLGIQGSALHVDIINDYVQLPKDWDKGE